MIAGPAAADAIARAHRLPRLRVGLHLVLVEGRPVLPAHRLPDLVDNTEHFRTDLARLGFDIFTRPSVSRQVAAEIEAQFEAYRASGLALDHVNAHKHFHLHPTVAGQLIATGQRFGVRGLRVPLEPESVLSKIEPSIRRRSSYLTKSMAEFLRFRARRSNLKIPTEVFGLAWSGAMTESRLCGVLANLSEGRTEIYMHPATGDNFSGSAPGYRYSDELAALCAKSALGLASCRDIVLGGYSDF
jgi:hopanoid biosynthesis associated protein HpnK